MVLELAIVDDLDDYRSGDGAAILGQVEAAVRAYCGWHVAPSRTETLTLDGSGGRLAVLPTLKMTDLVSITDDEDVVDLDDVDWSETGYLIRRCGRWSCRPRGVVVEFEHGYTAPPADVVAVVVAAAARAAASPSGSILRQVGQVAYDSLLGGAGFAGGIALLQHERDALAPYRLPPTP